MVTFEHMELTRFLLIVEITSFVFLAVRLSETFIWSKDTLDFIADFGLRKRPLPAETRFAILELCQKNQKIGFFVILVGEKVVSVPQAYFLK